MENGAYFVSIIIPCRNEENFMARCLDSVLENDYPKDKLEIFVIDGMSDDGTGKILEKYTNNNSFIKILKNKDKYTPYALNMAIKASKGDIIMRMDAHATYSKDYISKCLFYLDEYKADSVGGIWKIIPQRDTFIGNAISITQTSSFGAGNALYRFAKGKPVWVDTVPYFCCRREVFERIGLFNERLIRGQDMEFNLRLKKAGGRILLAPDVVSFYYVRSDLKSFLAHCFTNGVWAILPMKYTKIMPVSPRHLVPLFFALSVLGTLFLSIIFDRGGSLFIFVMGLYALIDILFSLSISLKRGVEYFIILPILFFLLHMSYGLGSARGLLALIFK